MTVDRKALTWMDGMVLGGALLAFALLRMPGEFFGWAAFGVACATVAFGVWRLRQILRG